MAAAKKPAPRVEVTLKAPLTHRGEDKQPGDKVDVTEDQKVWLEKRNII